MMMLARKTLTTRPPQQQLMSMTIRKTALKYPRSKPARFLRAVQTMALGMEWMRPPSSSSWWDAWLVSVCSPDSSHCSGPHPVPLLKPSLRMILRHSTHQCFLKGRPARRGVSRYAAQAKMLQPTGTPSSQIKPAATRVVAVTS